MNKYNLFNNKRSGLASLKITLTSQFKIRHTFSTFYISTNKYK